MIAKTLNIISATSKDSMGKSWETVWIPYQIGVYGVPFISIYYNSIISKDPSKSALGILRSNGRAILDRAMFRKW